MKSTVCIAVCGLAAGLAGAQTTYVDAVGNTTAGGDLHDFFAVQGFNHLDIMEATLDSDGVELFFEIRLNADIDATTWGNYMIAIDSGAGGDTGNGWGRPIDFGGVEIDHWIGSWANDGLGNSDTNGQVWNYNAGWSQDAGLSSTDNSGHAAGYQRFGVALADLGLSVGDTIFFDIMTSGGGGGDPGVDHLSQAGFSTDQWSNGSTSGQFLSYTIVPAPSSVALLGLGGLAIARRRR